MTVIIYVRGGLVTDVEAEGEPPPRVVVVDYDAGEEEGEGEGVASLPGGLAWVTEHHVLATGEAGRAALAWLDMTPSMGETLKMP